MKYKLKKKLKYTQSSMISPKMFKVFWYSCKLCKNIMFLIHGTQFKFLAILLLKLIIYV